MLKLKNITKDYVMGDNTVHALRGVELRFRDSEFVCVLGPSGCGKTTLLNIIGGLDQYTDGNMFINGRSTKKFTDHDWDTYRNHSVGFVFQNYNLIPHQTVLSNVELALTISGVSKLQRTERAKKALEDVGLGDQIDKRPNQMSGGQMQRVAIARALVNDPDILLADEPTGALDSETSVQVMELLKEISHTRLVVMVTHNPDLAEQYATRVVRLLDGRVTDDSDPYTVTAEEIKAMGLEERGRDKKRPSMSFLTALSLSLNNLLTKKARTLLTAFAGSIGIIGIALIMSLSNGIQLYIDRVQEDTLSSYPITIDSAAMELSSLVLSMTGASADEGEAGHELDAVYSNVMLYDLLDRLTSVETTKNDLKSFREYLEEDGCPVTEHASAVMYSYDLGFDIYTEDKDGAIVKTDVVELLQSLMTRMYGGDYSSYFSTMGDMYSTYDVWQEMLPGADGEPVSSTMQEQYDVIYGRWPQKSDELILIVDKNNEVSDLVLYALGLKTDAEMTAALEASMSFDSIDASVESWSYEDLCSHSFKLLLPSEYYQYEDALGRYVDLSATPAGLDYLYNSEDMGTTLKIVGIVRQNDDAVSAMMTGAIGYTSLLTDALVQRVEESDIVKAQLADESMDVILGVPFASAENELTDSQIRDAAEMYISGLDDAAAGALYAQVAGIPDDAYVEAAVNAAMKETDRATIEGMMAESYAAQTGMDAAKVKSYIASMDDETLMSYVRDMMEQGVREQYAAQAEAQLARYSAAQLAQALWAGDLKAAQYRYIYEEVMPPMVSDSDWESNLELLGYVREDSPDGISIYASTFADKDAVSDAIDEYNERADEEQVIHYTDYVALLMSSITVIIKAISYVLIAFVAISLVVSSIMIGIITYISVLERTKEIGVLRAIGASKGDVSRVFNAETLIEGLAAGAMGILLARLLIFPINAVVYHYTQIENLKAVMPLAGAVGLVILSMVLTLVAGVIPSRIAARRDPVEALRTE